MTHTERIQAALAERASGFPLIAPRQADPEQWVDPELQDVLNRAAHKAAERRFTGALPSAFGGLQ